MLEIPARTVGEDRFLKFTARVVHETKEINENIYTHDVQRSIDESGVTESLVLVNTTQV